MALSKRLQNAIQAAACDAYNAVVVNIENSHVLHTTDAHAPAKAAADAVREELSTVFERVGKRVKKPAKKRRRAS